MPTEPTALPAVPAVTPVTVMVSPMSLSESLFRTLPVGLVPAAPLLTPPASIAVAVSTTAWGASLTLVTVIWAEALFVEKAVVPRRWRSSHNSVWRWSTRCRGLVPGLVSEGSRFAVLAVWNVADLRRGSDQQSVGSGDRAEVGPSAAIGGVLPGAAAGDGGDRHPAEGTRVDVRPGRAAEDGRGERSGGVGILVGPGQREVVPLVIVGASLTLVTVIGRRRCLWRRPSCRR